jgi:ATP-dependent DNA helicase DinG
VTELLAAAVAGIGGAERPGQVAMAEAVEHAIASGEHLAVQAGTGTGKSLAYLVPAIQHAVSTRSTVVVATATIALQRQLIDRDLPRLVTAVAPVLGTEPACAGGGVAPGFGQCAGVHRRPALPVRLAVLRREGPGGGG